MPSSDHQTYKILNDLQVRATTICLERYIPFALFMFPGDMEAHFIACLPDDEGRSAGPSDGETGFFIGHYCGDEDYTPGVKASLTAQDILSLVDEDPGLGFPFPKVEPTTFSTQRINYNKALSEIRTRIKKIGGKGVLSRLEAVFTTVSPVIIADEYFAGNRNAFRYLCSTPETGLWLGATPELLAETDRASGTIKTMAVAGTHSLLPEDHDYEWDQKNIHEHLIVKDFIVDTLSEAGLTVKEDDTQELDAGDVTHLVTPISARGENIDYMGVINRLSPTPAVVGTPRDIAIAEIDSLETHRRHCYTGLVGVRVPGDDVICYVNLRCAFGATAHIKSDYGWVWNLYAGGGIMAESIIADEWEETEMKLAPLKRVLHLMPGDTKQPDIIKDNPYDASVGDIRLPF